MVLRASGIQLPQETVRFLAHDGRGVRAYRRVARSSVGEGWPGRRARETEFDRAVDFVRVIVAWRTGSLKSDESSSAATAGIVVRSGLRIVRAMQPSHRAERDC
jgi:hypothetical protein